MLDPEDPYHAAARTAFDRAAREGWRLVTTRYVFVEAWALVQVRKGWPAVEALLDSLLARCETIEVDARLHELGAARCRQARLRRLSLTDGVSLEVIQRHGVREVIARDRHFSEAGLRQPA